MKIERPNNPDINVNEMESALNGWINGVEDPNDGFNLELHSLLGIFESFQVEFLELVRKRNLAIGELVPALEAYRVVRSSGKPIHPENWEWFSSNLSTAKKDEFIDRLETDEEGLANTLAFFSGSFLVDLVPENGFIAEETAHPDPSRSDQRSSRPSLSADYDAWNRVFASEFFNPDNAGKPVFLNVDDEVLARIGSRVGVTNDAESKFFASVCSNIQFQAAASVQFARFDEALLEWSSEGGLSTPPHVALLAFFCRVAEHMHSDENFWGTNYTDRYVESLGLEPGTYDAEKAKTAFRRSVAGYFTHLNDWLERYEGEFGEPTAYALDHRPYVGLPVGQALIRSSDRDKFGAFFEFMQLRPGESMSLTDMKRLLGDWIPSSNLPQLLKRTWARSDSWKQQIADFAVRELQTWPGPSIKRPERSDLPKGQDSNVLLTASIRRRLGARLTLGLVMPYSAGLKGESLRAVEADSVTAKLLESSGGKLGVNPAQVGGVLEIDSHQIDFSALLQVKLDLEDPATGENLSWIPRRLFVLRRDPDLPGRYVQQSRIGLGGKSIVLADQRLAGEVEQYLSKVARPGYQRLDSTSLKGLPEDWTIFEKVSVVDAALPKNPDLAPLGTEIHRTRISFEGGMRVSGGNRSVWHSSAPPEVTITAQNHEYAAVEVSFTSINGGELDKHLVRDLDHFQSSTSFDITKQSEAGHLVVNLFEPPESRSPETRRIQLIRGTAPRPLAISGISYELGRDPLGTGIWFASPTDADEQSGTIRGATVTGNPVAPTAEKLDSEAPIPSTPPQSYQPEDDSQTPLRIRVKPEDSVKCIVNGEHLTVLPEESNTQGSGRGGAMSTEVIGSCKYCGRRKRHYQRIPSHWSDYRQSTSSIFDIEPILSPLKEPVSSWEPANPDLVLDSLVYLRRGNWNSFRRLALQIDDHPAFPEEFARTLEALGYMEVERVNGAPLTWSIMPSALVVNSSGQEAFLTGARSDNEIEYLRQISVRYRLEFVVSANSKSPSRVALLGLDENILSELEPELEIMLVRRAPESIVEQLPRLRDAIRVIQSRDVATGTRAATFDVNSGKWMDGVYRAGVDGAYRFGGWRSWYGYDDGKLLRQVDYRTAKHLAVNSKTQPLIGYDPDEKQLRVALGAELPGLFDRVATLCSGLTATQHPANPGVVVYQQVPPRIASAIYTKIYS